MVVLIVSVGLLNNKESNSDGVIRDSRLDCLVGVVEEAVVESVDDEGSKRGDEDLVEGAVSRLLAAAESIPSLFVECIELLTE